MIAYGWKHDDVQGKATLLGHPIHPMVIPFPIAFFTGAFIADVLDGITGGAFWPSMAATLIGFGIAGALLAAVFGFVDYFTAPMSPPVKRTATLHMIVNLLLVLLFAASLWARLRTPGSWLAYLLSTLGIVALAYAGWLGGALAYKHHLGVADEAPTRSAVSIAKKAG